MHTYYDPDYPDKCKRNKCYFELCTLRNMTKMVMMIAQMLTLEPDEFGSPIFRCPVLATHRKKRKERKMRYEEAQR